MLAAYLVGSINFSILLFRISGKADPCTRGSGNAGATNIYRQAGLAWALAVLLLDAGRGVLTAWMAAALLPMPVTAWVGLALILGNRYPCFHGFKGGKGVANFLGFALYFAPGWTLGGLVAYGAGVRLGKQPFIGSLLMVTILAVGIYFATQPGSFGLIALCSIVGLIFYAHGTNFSRLRRK